MKKLAIALIIVCCAGVASGGVIYDIQVNGLYTPGDIVQVPGAVVTAVAYNGVWVADGTFGPGEGIWVYLGSHTFLPGDVLNITADYIEYYDLSELDAGGYDDDPATDSVELVGSGTPLGPLFVSAAEIMANAELYEGNFVMLTDAFRVTEFLTYGEWMANSWDGGPAIWFDDVMFDESVLLVGDCYNTVTGAWHYSFGNYKLLPTTDGLIPVLCAVPNETTSFGDIKALYR